ncbi:MAG: sugar transporter ATP-binding protein [Aeromicrobium sp.]|jgi:ribose transport system ATP-binding protein|uniref:sugar ABC transporter ATP-binding protein n=1 Tax=Aeromicrobium sp. TaxID=1871063 RepID=UPI0026198D0E|nr:sugar ABC transporter ATP-binding protein [Aeromicrobium sp.]MCW2823142.1 sugar transporter ATP-binding protein [Aeromicrobium sp.]
MTSPLLEMRGIVKEFPGVRALDGVDLAIRAGEVHCLLGQNGAGKSTLIKVLAGAHGVDEGTILWDGEPVTFADPQAALHTGIATIYQELDLVDGLSVADNIFLGHEKSRGGITRDKDMNRATRELLATLGHPEIRPTREVGSLSAAGKQIVSMARALSRQARVIVMDEPSAVLDPDEVDGLFRVVEDLRASGAAIIYISHRLEEIRRIGDRLTVLKDGRTVAGDLPAKETPTSELITLMTGRSVSSVFPRRTTALADAAPLLSVDALGRDGEFADVTFDVRPGEIIGIAGLVGAGRSEIIETIFGARRAGSGSVSVAGSKLRNGSVAAAVGAGLGLCPEERKSQGLVLDDAVYRNISLASLDRFSRHGVTDSAAERRATHEAARSVDVRPDAPDRIMRTLSGGNQQKVVLARWLLRSCKILLLDEPTRGVDVGARAEIYALIRELADSGVALVVVSSDIDEVLGLSDRVLVVADGSIVHHGPSDAIDASGVLNRILATHDQKEDVA